MSISKNLDVLLAKAPQEKSIYDSQRAINNDLSKIFALTNIWLEQNEIWCNVNIKEVFLRIQEVVWISK